MNQYTLLKAANRTVDNDDIFNKALVMNDIAYIEDFTKWTMVGHDESLEILTDTIPTITRYPTLPPNSIKAETISTDNLVIANKEFDDIVRSIVKEALEEGQPLRAS